MAALGEAVAEVRQELRDVARAHANADAGTAAMLETQRRELHASLAEARRELSAEISTLAQQSRDHDPAIGLVEGLRREMDQALADVVQRTLAAVSQPLEELKDRQQALEEKLSEGLAEARAETLELLAERPEVASTDDLAAAVERRLSEAQAGMTALLDAERKAVGEGLDRLRADVASLAQTVERRTERAAQEALDAVSAPLRDLTRAHLETDRAIEILSESVETGATRQQALERKLTECVERIARLLEPPPHVDPGTLGGGPGEILQALDRQLRAAEERLAQR